MAIGDRYEVESVPGVHYVDVGMYDTPEYGSVYLVEGERPAVVDTGLGTRYEVVLEALADIGVEPADLEVIAPTHVHLDHAGGAGYLARECPNADVYVHEVGAPHLVDPARLVEGTKRVVGRQWEYYADPLPVDEDRIVELTDGDRIDLGDRELVAHHTPGHAPHQVSFELPSADAVFVADAAGIYVPAHDSVEPTTPPSNFDLERSLVDVALLDDLDPETLLYSHYGPVPADGTLSTYADTLDDWVADVEAVREAEGDDEAVVEQFAERSVERMGDVWGERKAREEGKLNVRGVLRYLDTRDD